MRYAPVIFAFILPVVCYAQPEDTVVATTPHEVTVRAYEYHRVISQVAAAVSYISPSDLRRFSNSSIVPVLNATVGIRMEERSPGSYRLNIRGSSIRSPFGVRNVKVYYNNIPFTDPGGQTYFNQLGFNNIHSLEVIKGPGSSLYGSGTGGVLLIDNDPVHRSQGVSVEHVIGSYGMQNSNIHVNIGNSRYRTSVNYQRQLSSGYRDHSSMRRDVVSWESSASISPKDKLTASFFFGDLFYETPGALTLEEYNTEPRRSRPGNAFNPGPIEAQAAIFQKTFLAGANFSHAFNERWHSSTSVYGAFTSLNNAAIRNYSRSNEPHFGGRSMLGFSKAMGKLNLRWQAGAELQQGYATATIYDNRRGTPDTLRLDDAINTSSYFLFTQLFLERGKWNLTTGVSYNRQHLNTTHFVPLPYEIRSRNFDNKLAPRLALLYKITPAFSAYSSVSRGFSPPTTAELYPTGSAYNPSLKAEEGWNYDIGVRGSLLTQSMFLDINAFYFRLHNTIVQRRDAAGGDYFENAGSTRQRGIETQVWYQLFAKHPVFAPGRVWLSHTFHHFRYENFRQLNNDFSGRKLPGVPPHSVGAGVDLSLKLGGYANVTYQYVDGIPLNDANDAFAESYHLLAVRIGVRKVFSNFPIEVFAGAENIFDEKYSLGNDINAFGGRYFNAAAGRNYFVGIAVGLTKKPLQDTK